MKQLLAVISLCFIGLTVFAADFDPSTLPENAPPTDSEILNLEREVLASQTQPVFEKPEKRKKFYVATHLGVGAYPEVSNVDKGYNVSVAAGYQSDKALMYEVGFGLAKSQLSVKNNLKFGQRDNFDITQYQGNLAGKYRLEGLLGTNIKPVAGLVVSYTYRKYGQTNNQLSVSGNTGTSSSIDGGISGGVDYDLNRSFAVGVDFRYMFNLANQVNANYINPSYGYNGMQLETLQYYVAGVGARMNF